MDPLIGLAILLLIVLLAFRYAQKPIIPSESEPVHLDTGVVTLLLCDASGALRHEVTLHHGNTAPLEYPYGGRLYVLHQKALDRELYRYRES